MIERGVEACPAQGTHQTSGRLSSQHSSKSYNLIQAKVELDAGHSSPGKVFILAEHRLAQVLISNRAAAQKQINLTSGIQ